MSASDSEIESTPLRGTIRKIADRTPDPDISPEHKKTCSDIQMDDLKVWFKSQVDLIRADIQQQNTEFKSEINELRGKLSEKDETIADLENNVMALSNDLDRAQAAVEICQEKIAELELRVDDEDQYIRRPCLRISGEVGPFRPGQDYRKMVVDLVKEIDVQIGVDDIDRAHCIVRTRKI
jgi:uncharacterized coiled-coil protein SlyX